MALVADHWTAPTPCDEWDVRWLCAHVVGGNRFAVLILGGVPADDALSQVRAMRHIGERPIEDLRAGAADHLDDDLVRRVLADVDGGPIGAVPGAAEKAAPPGLSDQDRLLLLTGRDPAWTPPAPPPS